MYSLVLKFVFYRLFEENLNNINMEAEIQAQIPGLDHIISEYSVVSLKAMVCTRPVHES